MTVITLGTFDILHAGHINLLKKCRELSDRVVVGLNSDEFIEKYKGKPPVMSYEERKEMIELTGLVDLVVSNSQPDGTIKTLLSNIQPDLIVIGSDWARKDYIGQLGVDWDYLDSKKIGICYVTYTSNISTTEIKKRISASNSYSNNTIYK